MTGFVGGCDPNNVRAQNRKEGPGQSDFIIRIVNGEKLPWNDGDIVRELLGEQLL